MFDDKYSLLRFSNRSTKTTDLNVNMIAISNIQSVIFLGGTIEADLHARSIINSKIEAVRQIASKMKANSQILASLNWSKFLPIRIKYFEILKCEANLGSKINLRNELHANVKLEAKPSKKISIRTTCNSNVFNNLLASKKIPISATCRDSILCLIALDIVMREIFTLTVDIPPGGEIRIDSKLYNIFLNNENIIHTHAGDWFFISRNARTLQISNSSNAELEGVLVYEEAFL